MPSPPLNRLSAIFARPLLAPRPLDGVLSYGYRAGLQAYSAGIVVRLCWAVVSLVYGLGWFAAYHVAAAALYVVARRVHQKGGVVSAFGLAILETITQAYVGAALVGVDAGFHAYLWPPIVISLLVPGVHRPAKRAFVIACLAAQAGIIFGFVGTTPAVTLPPLVLAVFRFVNWLGAVSLATTWAMRFAASLAEAESEARAEHERAALLLANVLPDSIVERLKAGESEIADGFRSVTVLFADLVGFTRLAANRAPAELVTLLDRLFTHFDAVAEKHGIEKIKTIGDAYMCATGVPVEDSSPAERMAAFALDLRDSLAGFDDGGAGLSLRIGLATGPAVAGVIGKRKFSYDLWGDTVNTASRMESHGEPGRIHLDARTHDALGDAFRCTARGSIDVKGKGPMETWFLEGRA